MPPGVLITTHLVPELLRMTMYVLIAQLAGGAGAALFAACGAVALITVRMTVSEHSGVPVEDVWHKTMGMNSTAVLPLYLQYTLRSLPLQAVAVIDGLVAFSLVRVIAPDHEISVGAWLLSLCCVPSGVAFGTAISAFCLGKNMHNMVHNIAASILTVCSGAVIPAEDVPVARFLAPFLPVAGSAQILQSGEVSAYAWHLAGRELLVALMWGACGAALYSVMVRRSRRSGSTYLGT
nr:hypothetical protein [Actinomyces sp.]